MWRIRLYLSGVSSANHSSVFFSLFFVRFVALRYGHGGTVSSPNHTFSCLGKLEQAVNQYFVHILSLALLNNSAEGRRMTVEIIS